VQGIPISCQGERSLPLNFISMAFKLIMFDECRKKLDSSIADLVYF
jgi:hypothetical protein